MPGLLFLKLRVYIQTDTFEKQFVLRGFVKLNLLSNYSGTLFENVHSTEVNMKHFPLHRK